MTGTPTPESANAARDASAAAGERIAPVRPLAPHRRRRARRSLLAEWPLTIVLLVVGGGIALIAFASFRLGALLIAVGVLLGFALRLLLSERAIGMLAVRSRALDLSILGIVGIMLAVLAFIVPAPS